MPPIFQPEIAADAVYWSAHHRRRELWLGASTIKAILAQKWIPGLADWYLARTGYAAQQTDQPRDENRKHNLWEALDSGPEDDHGAHGAFDSRAIGSSVQLPLAKHRPWITAGLAGIGVGIGAAWLAGKRA